MKSSQVREQQLRVAELEEQVSFLERQRVEVWAQLKEQQVYSAMTASPPIEPGRGGGGGGQLLGGGGGGREGSTLAEGRTYKDQCFRPSHQNRPRNNEILIKFES